MDNKAKRPAPSDETTERPHPRKPSSAKLERSAPPAGSQEDLDNKTDWEQDHEGSRE
jgi:hypothetical protein